MLRAFAILLCLAGLPLCAGETVLMDPQPTPEETLILEFLNRLRADPQADLARIAPGGQINGWMGRGVDTAMFLSEMKALKSAPPLVFNLELLAAARKHSLYMIHNTLTHVEEEGKAGFVAKDFSARCKLAGYSGAPGGENCYRDAGDPWQSHCGFVIDFGAGPGGMQPGRGHRSNMMNPSFREIGCSVVPHSGRISVTHNFGIRNARMAGGVVYFDRNHNGCYDLGEGIAGVKIVASDGSGTTTWNSGAYALDLKKSDKATLSFEFAGEKSTQAIEAGKENVKFDWIVPENVAIERAAQLLAAVDKLKDKASPQYFNALVALYVGTQGLLVEPEQQRKITELTQTLGAELQAHQKAVLNELQKPEPGSWQAFVAEHHKPYRATVLNAWFKDAETAGVATLALAGFARQAEQMRPQERKNFIRQLEETERQLSTTEFKPQLASLIAQAKALDKPPQKKR